MCRLPGEMEEYEKSYCKLYFKNFVFLDKSQIQTTVRRGVKWAERTGNLCLEPTDIPREGYLVTFARIVKTEVYRFGDIPIDVLRIDHDSNCRSYGGLKSAMHRAYEDFSVDDLCTVIWFRLT